MSYIGKQPEFTQYPSKFFDGDGSAMTVTLDYAPPNDAALLVFIDGVRQDTSAYNCTGTSCVFTGSVPSGTNNVQVVHMGLTLDVGVPGDDTVTLAKLEDGTQGNILYYGASGAPARLGVGTSGEVLKTQGTGANPVWGTIEGSVITTQNNFFKNWNTVTGNQTTTIASTENAGIIGPITVNSGVTWTIVGTLNFL